MHNAVSFYETSYHYGEDVAGGLDDRRLRRFFRRVNAWDCGRCLDVGCGVGWALAHCIGRWARAMGFDISLRAVAYARQMLGNKADLLVADGEDLPFRERSFDFVYSLGTVEHFGDPEQGVSEIKRVTRRGGKILLVVPNSYGVIGRMRLYRGTEQPQEMLATLGQWGRMLARQGLEIVAVDRDVGPRLLKNRSLLGIIKRYFVRMTALLPVALAYQFVFTCQRK